MKSTNPLIRFSPLCIITFCFLLTLIVSSVCAEELMTEKGESKEPFQITSKIMSTNLNKQFFIISEKAVYLQYTEDKKTNVITWTTTLVDKLGQPVAPETFRPKDRVKVFGTKSSTGKITAKKIILLKPGPNHQPDRGGENIKKVNGVWVN